MKGIDVSRPPSDDRQERGPRVGLLTDRDAFAQSLISPCNDAGYQLVRLSATGEIAAQMVERSLDVLLVDAARTDRLELCGELRALEVGRATPIVFSSSHHLSESSMVELLLAGADDVCLARGGCAELMARIRVQMRNRWDRARLRRIQSERDHYRVASAVDPLTQLLNRRAIDKVVASAIEDRTPFAVLFLDIDHFKQINDRFGHDIGDEVLRMVAKCLDQSIRPTDKCGRYGGEEFIVVARGVTQETAMAVAERHRKALEKLVAPCSRLTASIGVAAFSPDDPDPSAEELYRRADAAVYEAKRTGRNRCIVSPRRSERLLVSTGTTQRLAGVDELEAALLKALATGRGGLPVLPRAAQDALELAKDPRSDFSRIARLVDHDPPLAARFVALANSPVYGAGVRVRSTHAALVRLGLLAARDLLLQIALERSSAGLRAYYHEVAACFRHAVLCGLAAASLAKERAIDTDDAYLCGLLHDIGIARIYRALSQISVPQPPQVVADLIAKHHERAGVEIAKAWGLPEIVQRACARHHDIDVAQDNFGRLMLAADVIADAAEGRPLPDAGFLARLDLTEATATALAASVRERSSDLEMQTSGTHPAQSVA